MDFLDYFKNQPQQEQQYVDPREYKAEQLKNFLNKISQLEKYVWMSVGGFTIITFLITHGHKFLAFIK